MYEAVMMAATGLTNQQRRIDSIADNVSNVNTVGYKAARLDFKDALYTAGMGPTASPDGNLQKGHGVMISSISKQFSQGGLLTTGEELDFAIDGEGFLEVRAPSGELLYTRAGNLYVGQAGDRSYLVNSQGYFVQNNLGERINVPEGTTSIGVGEDGAITFTAGDWTATDRFGLYTFVNKTGLSAAGNGNYEITVASGQKQTSPEIRIKQGALEASNVELATEMTRLIRAQRAFSLAGRALTTADDMEGIANNLKR